MKLIAMRMSRIPVMGNRGKRGTKVPDHLFTLTLASHSAVTSAGRPLPDQASTAGCNTPEFRKGENCGKKETGVPAVAGYVVYGIIHDGADHRADLQIGR